MVESHEDDGVAARVSQADLDRVRIAELRRHARIAQGPPDDPGDAARPPAARWTSDVGQPERVAVGPGQQVLTVEAASRRLGMTIDELRSKAQVLEIGGWGLLVVDVAEVERLEAASSC